MSELVVNPHREASIQWDDDSIAAFHANDILAFHQSLPDYNPTPLVRLPALAQQLGVDEILVKDESQRLGLKAFKVLGASYAIYRFLKSRCEQRTGVDYAIDHFHERKHREILGSIIFCTATDGNHGRGVARTARMLGERAVIFMPAGTVPARIDAIRGEGAEVTVVDGTYDQTVERAAAEARDNGWQVIADMSYEGYTEIPRWIMAGYTTMFYEIDKVLSKEDNGRIDCVIVQAGAGALAAAAAWYYAQHSDSPTLISVEPTSSNCLLRSIKTPDGSIHSIIGEQNSIMAGLNCGTPSLIAWPLIRDRFDAFLAIPDELAVAAMRKYYYPEGNDPQVISGESGAAGLAGLLALAEGGPDFSLGVKALIDKIHTKADPSIHSPCLDESSRVLLLNTEGDTDRENFRRVVT